MKRTVFSLLLALTLVAALAAPAQADGGEFDHSLWRYNDYSDFLDEAAASELDDYIFAQVEAYGIDLPICVDGAYEDYSLAEYGAYFYEHNGFGCGSAKNGVLLVIDTAAGAAEVLPFGADVTPRLSAQACESIRDRFLEQAYEDYLAALYAYLDDVTAFFYASETAPVAGRETEALPDWYPEDAEAFVDFYDPDAPRLVDRANLFTEAERTEITRKLAALKQKYGSDFVVYTDTSDYGLGRGLCAADFFIFNGYGTGSDSDGMILFINMEPGDRGWWEAGTGARSEPLFNEENVNRLDDRLEGYLVAGDYGAGVSGFLDDVGRMYATGRAPRTTGMTALLTAVSLLAGGLTGGVTLGALRSSMKRVRTAAQADDYLVPGSFALRGRRDRYLYTHTSRRRIERSSGGGGGSSHSSGYHSSSGHSFSGGGRRF